MQSKKLSPNQIITLNDFPLHNEHFLKIFFRIYQKKCGKIIPPVPVMHKDLVMPHFDAKLKKVFESFSKKNSESIYFMLDGSHRTTAANLTNNKINVIILSNESDIKEAKELAKIGELFHFFLKDDINGIIDDLLAHFRKKSYFQTVQQKTNKMVNQKIIPQYMISYYKKNKL